MYGDMYLPELYNGSNNLDSFIIQFEIACQINKWPENQKGYWLIQCLEGPALSYIQSIIKTLPIEYEILKQILCKTFEPPENCWVYRTTFYERKRHENESLSAYGWDLKLLAMKAYPDHTLLSLEPVIVKQFICGLQNAGWSEHIVCHKPETLQEAIDIALERKKFKNCLVCSNCCSFNTTHENTSRYVCLTNLQPAKHTKKKTRFKPYDKSKPCLDNRSKTSADVLKEHTRLQKIVSSEEYYAWDLVEVIVEVPSSNVQACIDNSQECNQSQDNSSGTSENILLSVESTEDSSCHGTYITNRFSHCGAIECGLSNNLSFQPQSSRMTQCKAVVILKLHTHDNSVGVYYPNIVYHLYVSCVSVLQTNGYLIRCQKRDFPD